MYQKKLEKDIRCPLEYGLSVFGGKWKSRIICVLAAKETLRYSELRGEMANITDAVLATTLKELIADGILVRQSYDEILPRVEYFLTEKGKSVVPILQSICHWSGIFIKKKRTRRCLSVSGAITDKNGETRCCTIPKKNALRRSRYSSCSYPWAGYPASIRSGFTKP